MFRSSAKRRQNRLQNRRFIRFQQLEKRNLLAAVPLGATEMDTGEFLLGRVAVTPVFFESDGSIDTQSQNWTSAEIDEMLAKIGEGVNWWAETLDGLNSVHSLEFVIDDTYAKTPIQTPYELIDRNSEGFELAVGKFMDSLTYPGSTALQDAVLAFNHDQRVKLNTDWAFTIFVVDSSDDIDPKTGEHDGFFAPGGFFSGAFAFSGGLFMVTPSTRPASTIAHEMGHIFWARDEYPGSGSWTDRRGYYNAQNLNASNNPTGGFVQEDSIMRGGYPLTVAYDNHTSPASTLALLGWQDSDNDGIFDVADVPLQLEGVGYFDTATSTYHFDGHASAVALVNKNSEGPQSDITLNRVSQIQYRLDDGPWIVALEPNQQVLDIDLAVVIDHGFSTIEWRAVDLQTTVTSKIIQGTIQSPAIASSSITGFAFLDEDNNSIRSGSESFMSNVSATIRHADGSPLFSGEVDANTLPEGTIASDSLSGVVLTTQGFSLQRQLGVFDSPIASNQQFFQSFDAQVIVWSEQWDKNKAFVAKFDQDVGEVDLQIWGTNTAGSSYGRIEAYDRNGILIKRVTSDALQYGDSMQLSIQDDLGGIAEIRAYGHAETSIAISDLNFGFNDQLTTNESGALQFSHLPDGEYIVQLATENLIYALDNPTPVIQVAGGTSADLVAIARRISSPRHNPQMAGDVNQDQVVTANDALIIINDLNINQPRTLKANETQGQLIDVNNDGVITALDALLVINSLTADGRAGEGEIHSERLLVQDLSGNAEPTSHGDAPLATESQGSEPQNSVQVRSQTPLDNAFAQWPGSIEVAQGENQGRIAVNRLPNGPNGPLDDQNLKISQISMTTPVQPQILPFPEENSEKFPQNLVVNEKSLSTMGSESIDSDTLTDSNLTSSIPAI